VGRSGTDHVSPPEAVWKQRQDDQVQETVLLKRPQGVGRRFRNVPSRFARFVTPELIAAVVRSIVLSRKSKFHSFRDAWNDFIRSTRSICCLLSEN